MDGRIPLRFGKRVSRLRKQDLPDLAYALTTLARHPHAVEYGYDENQGLKIVYFRSQFFAVTVLLDDWMKIEPKVREGYFAPNAFPVQEMSPKPPAPPQVGGDPLYNHILNVLTLLFPESYPTSSI